MQPMAGEPCFCNLPRQSTSVDEGVVAAAPPPGWLWAKMWSSAPCSMIGMRTSATDLAVARTNTGDWLSSGAGAAQRQTILIGPIFGPVRKCISSLALGVSSVINWRAKNDSMTNVWGNDSSGGDSLNSARRRSSRLSRRISRSSHLINKRYNLIFICFGDRFLNVDDAGGNIRDAFDGVDEIPSIKAFVEARPVWMFFEACRGITNKYFHPATR